MKVPLILTFIFMSEDFIKQTKSVAFVVLAFSAAVYVYQYGRSVDQTFPTKTFSVDGEAKMETATDIATFSVSVITEGDKNVSSLQKQNTEKMNTINAFLGEQGVEKKDLQTSQYALTPRYSYADCNGGGICPPPTIVGYTLTQSLTVKVRNFESLGDILSGIVTKGANTVSGVSFTVDDTTYAKQVARTEAIAKAKQKAVEIARAGNFHVGQLISLYEDSSVAPLDTANYGMGGGGNIRLESKAVPSPTIEPGTQSDTVHMNLTYEIVN